jgi:hypothetical protein
VTTAVVATFAVATSAKTILFDAKIVTADQNFSIAEALAIDDNTIVAVGSYEQILRSQGGPNVERIDLGGKTVVPGLIDGHFHFIRAAAFWRSELRLEGVTSRSTALEALRQRATSAPRETWIVTLADGPSGSLLMTRGHSVGRNGIGWRPTTRSSFKSDMAADTPTQTFSAGPGSRSRQSPPETTTPSNGPQLVQRPARSMVRRELT